MAGNLPTPGVLRVVSNAELDEQDRRATEQKIASLKTSDEVQTGLGNHIRTRFQVFQSHRNDAAAGWSERLLAAFRTFHGEYSPSTLQAIKQFGGSEVYARITAMKCRGASALLREVYLHTDRPYGIDPPPDPEVPEEVVQQIIQMASAEANMMAQQGQPPPPDAMRDRVAGLMEAARQAARKRAAKTTKIAEDKIEEILRSGSFYNALDEFLTDLPLFPFACIKGPTVRIMPDIEYKDGQATQVQKARLVWSRVSPFDLWWTPGCAVEDAEVIERTRLTRAALNDLLDLPGYNHDAIREILTFMPTGRYNFWDQTDSERATLESKENPHMQNSGLLTCLEYHGNVQGKLLRQYGMTEKEVPDEVRDYFVQAWLIDRHVIKVQLAPSPRKQHPYFITSFEKVPGTSVGNGLPDILEDIQTVCNASLRSIVNNLSISSGPQVIVNDSRIVPGGDNNSLYPWKRWHIQSETFSKGGAAEKPIDFFQPRSNAGELLAVYKEFSSIADELSAIPKYLSGTGVGSGAGRTASGLAMLMGNASKLLQTVAGNIDRDVLSPALVALFDMLLLTGATPEVSGEESIRVLGVNVAVQRETQRSRQLEFLQVTANPVDMQIIGPGGRAKVLRAVSHELGLESDGSIVPSEEEIMANIQKAQEQALQQGGEENAPSQAQGNQSPRPTQDMGPRTNIAGGVG